MAEKDSSDFTSYRHPSTSHIVQEFKDLWAMALPITAMNCTAFFRQVVSVLFLGRLGSLELAGGALAIGFTNITGYSVLVGLASGLEPVCSQAYGTKNYALLTRSLRRMVTILLTAAVPIALLWILLDPIMVALGQDKEVTAMAAKYCLYSLPDLFTNAVLQPVRVYLRSQRVTKPMMYCSLAAIAFHLPLNYVVVVSWGCGVGGVAVASVVTNVNTVVLLAGYVWWSGRWYGGGNGSGGRGGELSDDDDDDNGGGFMSLLRLAVPSCIGICLEWWWYEIVTVLAGYLPNPKVSVAATGVLIQTTSLMYTVPMALAGCASARVGNELGAGRPYKAKLAAMVALGCAFLVGIIHVTWTSIFRQRWGGLFTPDPSVQALVASVMPIMGLCELGNCPQTTGCGILRGTARPAIGARINLGSFYFVGTPVAVGLAFMARYGFSGLWLGLLSAQLACVTCVLSVVLIRTDWEAEALRALKLTGSQNGLEMGVSSDKVRGTDANNDGDDVDCEETKRFLVSEKQINN